MSAHIAIRCDECGKPRFGDWMWSFNRLGDEAEKDGWESSSTIDTCPICVARRTLRERAEAAAK